MQRPNHNSGTVSDRVLGTIFLIFFLLCVIAILWYQGFADSWIIGYVGAVVIGIILYVALVLATKTAKPRRLAIFLILLILLVLFGRCKPEPAPVHVPNITPPIQPVTEPSPPPNPPEPAPEPPPPTPEPPPPPTPEPPPPPTPEPPPPPTPEPPPPPEPEPPVVAQQPEVIPKPEPPPPPVVEAPAEPPPDFDYTQILWERFVWDPQVGGRWVWREVAPEIWRTWSTDRSPKSDNMQRLRRERKAREGSEVVYSWMWPDGSSGTRLILRTEEPTAEDFNRVKELHQAEPEAKFVWEPLKTGTWGWRKLDQHEVLITRLRDSSTATYEYQRLKSENKRIPGSTLEWRARWEDGWSGWRLFIPKDNQVPISSTMVQGQIVIR